MYRCVHKVTGQVVAAKVITKKKLSDLDKKNLKVMNLMMLIIRLKFIRNEV